MGLNGDKLRDVIALLLDEQFYQGEVEKTQFKRGKYLYKIERTEVKQ